MQDLAIGYNNGTNTEIRAVDKVDFSIADGEIVGLLGESGCGKTSIGMALLGMLPRTASVSGTIYFGERELAGLSSRELRKVRGGEIAMIYQDPALALHPLIRVREQIGEVLRAHSSWGQRQRRGAVEKLLADLELGDVDRIGNSYPHQLSGGQCQRILIAQALICKPKLIVADEPTASLDVQTALTTIDLIRRINEQERIAFLFISHDPAVISAVAHRLIVMRAGKIVEQGVASQILRNPSHPYTRALLAARNGNSCQYGPSVAEKSYASSSGA
ncbi:MAG: ABC transporter ATP-binding protein [Terriglobales bacterium]